jgi:hypothetical protein
MNAAAGAAVRLGLHRGHTMLGLNGSSLGDGDVRVGIKDSTGGRPAKVGLISTPIPGGA